ncbi:MAG TPA: RNA-binding protein [Prevotella sp.]|nr:RNA-binding protein [Prevotella sp.]
MNIYVSNISYDTQEESFNALFAQYGEVSSARIITDRETGRSRGFGFVEMANDEEGQAAIDALNGTEFEGKELNVSVARERTERTNRGGGYGSRGGYGNRNSSYGNHGGGNGYGNRRGFSDRNSSRGYNSYDEE